MDILLASEAATESFAPYRRRPTRRERVAQMLPALLLGSLAAWLAWGANKSYGTSARVASSLLAFFFGGIYLIYYAVFKKCAG